MAAPKHEIKIVSTDPYYPTSASNAMSIQDARLQLEISQLTRPRFSRFKSKKKTGKRN